MPVGSQGQKRPQGETQAAVMVGKIATGQITEPQTRRLFAVQHEGGKAKATGRRTGRSGSGH